MSLNVGKAALQKNIGVIADDGVDAGGLIARENDTSQHKRNHVFPVQERFFNLRSGWGLCSFGGGRLFHLCQFEICLLVRAGAKERGVGGISSAAAKQQSE